MGVWSTPNGCFAEAAKATWVPRERLTEYVFCRPIGQSGHFTRSAEAFVGALPVFVSVVTMSMLGRAKREGILRSCRQHRKTCRIQNSIL